MKKSIYLLAFLSLICASCNSPLKNNLEGQWRTEKEFNGIPSEILSIEIKGDSVLIDVDQTGRVMYNGSGEKHGKTAGKIIAENEYKLTNGSFLSYNADLDSLYIYVDVFGIRSGDGYIRLKED